MRKLFLCLILVMLSISLSSAFLDKVSPIEPIKEQAISIGDKIIPYNPIWEVYAPISVKDWLGFGGTKFSGAITSHTDYCSSNCEDIIEVNLAQESALVDSIRFIDADSGKENNNVDYQFYVQIGTNKEEVNDYVNTCSNLINGSEVCNDKLTGTHIEEIPIWKEYNINDVMPSGDYTLKLTGSKTADKNIDWIMTTQGKEVSDWAVWGSTVYNTEGHDITTLRVVGADGNPMYFTIVPNKNITLTNISKVAGDLTPNVTVTDSAGSVLSEQTYSGNIATLATQVNLTAGLEYRLLSTRFTGTKYRNNSVNCGFPRNNTYVAWVSATYDCATINNVTFSFIDVANITMNSPANNTGTNNNTVNFNCTATQTGANVTNMSLYIDGVLNTTNDVVDAPSVNTKFTKFIPDGTYKWICEACDADNSCALAPVGNYTLTIDGTPPVIALIAPVGSQGYLIGSNNLSLNFTATDTNLNTCWYSYGNVNHTVSCSSGVEVDTPINLTNSNAKLILYVNDTSNNIASTSVPINYTLFENSQTYNSATTSFFNENFVLNFSYDSNTFNSISGNLIYNSTTNGVSLSNDGNNSIFNTTNSILGVNAPTNITFYWNIILGNVNGSVLVINTSSKKQLVTPMSIDDCTANSLKIMNLTIYDEDTNAFINSSNSSIMNSTINVQLWLSNPATPQNNITYYVSKNNTNPVYICVPTGNLTSTPFRMDSAVQYYSTGRITRWAYLQNYSLTDVTAPYSRILYDLLNTESQEFKITYKDSNFILVPNVIIDIKKYFVGSGYSASVEHGLTDSYGQTVGHFVLGTNSYSIDVYSQGNLLSSYPKIEPLCSNIATGDCIINLNALSSSAYTNWLTYQNLNYSYTFSEALRQLTLNWQLQDISHGTSTVNLTVMKFDALNNETICSITSTGTSGLFNCYVNTTFGNTTIEANLYKDNKFIGTSYFSLSNGEKTTFGNTGIIMAFIFVVCCGLMFTSSPTGTIIGAIMGLVLVSLLGLLAFANQNSTYSILALSGGIIWIIVTGIVILWKINGNQSSGGSA